MLRRFLTAFFITSLITGGYFYYLKATSMNIAEANAAASKANSLQTATGETESRVAEPTASVDFILTNQNGKQVTENDFKGKRLLVYFGYTHCPDVCPISMAVITEVMNQLGTVKTGNIQPVFISIDPQNDTPGVLRTYLRDYYPSFIALTGPESEIEKVKNSYRVYAEPPPQAMDSQEDVKDHARPPAHADRPGHSNLIYYMDENGKYLTHFTSDNAPEDIVDYITSH